MKSRLFIHRCERAALRRAAGGLCAMGLVAAAPAHALQTIEARDGVSVEAVMSVKEATRIKVDGAAITDVFGNIYSSNCGAAPSVLATAKGAVAGVGVNPGGEIVLECDRDKGEIYIKPVGAGNKPVNLFVSTAHATYTLVLKRMDMPADTIVLRDRSQPLQAQRGGPGLGSGRSLPATGSHVRGIKALMAVMATDKPGPDVRTRDLRQPVALWNEARMTLVRTYETRGLVGERYQLTNTSGETMVLAEQEFDRDDAQVVAVSIENLNLRPGETTVVLVIRREG
ncbi:MAG: type-F conjugative transfer system secretin TraK [Aquabacterium sp.]|nr:type-F conjugative transfer system secretin TraK [Aquabacterium sp.]